MKITVLSDSHDNVVNIGRVVDIANQSGCSWLIHLGDMVSPFAVETLRGFKGMIRAVFGNCDGERFGIQRAMTAIGGEIQAPPFKFQLENKHFILMHEPYLLDEVIKSQEADYVFYGHLHKVDSRQIGRTYVLNPGETGGWIHKPSFFIIDLETNQFEKIDL